MKLEDLKYEFPKMPDEMRVMIEKEVARQVSMQPERIKKNRRVRSVGKTIAASLAAVMLLGTTVFAGVGIYRLQRQQVGKHGVNVTITGTGEKTEQSVGSQSTGTRAKTLSDIPNVTMDIGYLPKGMEQMERGKYCFTDAKNKGGITIVFYRMDTGDHQFEMLHENVVSSEDFTADGHTGVYLEYPHLYEDEITFDKRIYVAFTDVHYVMQMYAASDVSKEDAIKIAKSITLTPTEKEGDSILVNSWDWSEYLAQQTEQPSDDDSMRITVAKEQMGPIYQIGDSFCVDSADDEQANGLMAKVADVQITDDIGILGTEMIDDDLKAQTDADGKLRPAVIQYIKNGSADSVDEVVKSREVPQKLVYVTVEYTNTGSTELSDVLFMGSLPRIQEKDGQMCMMPLDMYEEPADGDTWDRALNKGISQLFEMHYYDVHGGSRKNNYIPSIKPGETVTVHMAWVVTQEELGRLYLSLDTYGGAYEFSDSSLEMGYVDLRQQ